MSARVVAKARITTGGQIRRNHHALEWLSRAQTLMEGFHHAFSHGQCSFAGRKEYDVPKLVERIAGLANEKLTLAAQHGTLDYPADLQTPLCFDPNMLRCFA